MNRTSKYLKRTISKVRNRKPPTWHPNMHFPFKYDVSDKGINGMSCFAHTHTHRSDPAEQLHANTHVCGQSVQPWSRSGVVTRTVQASQRAPTFKRRPEEKRKIIERTPCLPGLFRERPEIEMTTDPRCSDVL